MIEQKLQQAANALPEPKGDFLAVEEAFKKQQTQAPMHQRKRRRLAWILCIAMLLTGCVMGPTVPEYHLYNGDLGLLFPGIAFDALCDEIGQDPELNSAVKTSEDLGWTIPEALGNSPQIGADKFNLTTQKSNWFMAMLFHHYTYHSVDYGFEMETEITLENGTPSTAHWTDKDVELTFGSMDNDVWRRQFGFDENNIWIGHINSNPPESTFAIEYKGYTLYGSSFYDGENFFYGLVSDYRHYIHWVDSDHNTVLYLYARDDTPDFVISCAKELIDQMHTEKPR